MTIIVMKEDVHTHRSLKIGITTHHTGPHREAPEWVRRKRARASLRKAFMVMFTVKTALGRRDSLGVGQFEEFPWTSGYRY